MLPGETEVEAVGEKSYQGALEALCGGKWTEPHGCHDLPVRAWLRREPNNRHDSNAVQVGVNEAVVWLPEPSRRWRVPANASGTRSGQHHRLLRSQDQGWVEPRRRRHRLLRDLPAAPRASGDHLDQHIARRPEVPFGSGRPGSGPLWRVLSSFPLDPACNEDRRPHLGHVEGGGNGSSPGGPHRSRS